MGKLTGVRASIKTPFELNWGSETGLFLARVDAEKNNGSGTLGLFQAGLGETSDTGVMFDDCGSRTTFHRFSEWKNYDSSGTDYYCQWFGPPSAGENDKYSVVRTNDVTYGWVFDLNGTSKEENSMNFDQATFVLAGNEFSGNPVANLILYGQAGSTDWQRTSDVGDFTWTTIDNQSCAYWVCNTGNVWDRTSLPTPFTISYSP